MGVDLSLILPNDCRDIYDNKHALEVFNKAIARVKEYFGGREGFVEKIKVYNSDSPGWGDYYEADVDPGEYSFDIPVLNVTCNMQQGYWCVEFAHRYSEYFRPRSKDVNGNIAVEARNRAFDVARIFGFSEGWICDEHHSWRSNVQYHKSASFEMWCAYGKSTKDAKIYEFGLGIFGDTMEPVHEYQAKYHDSFRECHSLVATYEQMYPEYCLLVLEAFEGLALASKGGEFYLLDLKTGESFLPYPIDCLHTNFKGAGFTVTRGTERAFFNNAYEQLTEFREGRLFVRGYRVDEHTVVPMIHEQATGRYFLADGTDIPPEEAYPYARYTPER